MSVSVLQMVWPITDTHFAYVDIVTGQTYVWKKEKESRTVNFSQWLGIILDDLKKRVT